MSHTTCWHEFTKHGFGSCNKKDKYRGYLSREVVFRLAIDVKTADFELKNRGFYENHSFTKTMDLDLKASFYENWILSPKTMVFAKTTDFGKNCSFWVDLRSNTAKTTFPTDPSRGQHQILKSMDSLWNKRPLA